MGLFWEPHSLSRPSAQQSTPSFLPIQTQPCRSTSRHLIACTATGGGRSWPCPNTAASSNPALSQS